ncbi:MAG: serine protease [Isosphaeraceae bacterium]|jgi:hypothetical protein|nr:MAG: serine protease [Isosphaeraceae bacterium]
MRRAFLGLIGLVICGGVIPAQGSTPALSAIRPPGGQRGTELDVRLSGARLGDAQEILWYQPGIETLSITKLDDNTVQARLRIAADARPGLYDLRLRTATGVSELRTFSVGLYPEIQEVEPNNDFAAPQPIALGTVVNGVAENEDVDYFAIEAKRGQRITVEVEGLRLGITHFDPYVAILNAQRFELASSDDATLVRVDGLASLVAPEDGTYIIQVRESAYVGNGACLYRLHVGEFPRPTAVFPAGGKLGQTVALRWIGDPAGERTEELTLPSAPDPTFALYAQDEHGQAPFPQPFRLSSLDNVLEGEPNDSAEQATPFEPPRALNGIIERAGDQDFFRFTAKKGQVWDIQCYARRLRSPLDPVLHVMKLGGPYIAGADDSVGPDSSIRFTAPDDGDYVVWVHDQLRQGGPAYVYRIELTPVEPKLTLYPPSEQAAIGIPNVSAAIPRGNRQAILIYASRSDWSGDLRVQPEALPPGVEAESDLMPASQPVVPVLLKAQADAPLGGMLTRFVGRPADDALQLAACDFNHHSVLVFGANNVDFWSRDVDRLAVVVTEEAPYEIEVVEPKVPLVNSGTMNLKVVARRKEGFTAPIAVYFPWLPPGVGASGAVQIPEGQSEALIPMNAGGAEARAWKLVVHGDATGPTGPIRVSSQLFTLRIDQPYLTLSFNNTACEQGRETDLAVQVNKARDWEGEAQVTLLGLPNNATTEAKRITKDVDQMIFRIVTRPDTPAGNHASLFCQVVITENGEPITHNLGTGALRVDVPIAPKADSPPPAADAPKPAEPAAKPLSRLEQLRQEAAARAAGK